EGARLRLERGGGDPAAREAVARAQVLARQGVDETRRAIAALRGGAPLGLGALRALVDELQDERGLPCEFELVGEPAALPADADLALYRPAQEALTNIRKHARADSVCVRLAFVASGVDLTIEDRGAEPPARAGDGYGLIGMRERAELLGGRLEADPTPTG